jgi:hypothetical protein
MMTEQDLRDRFAITTPCCTKCHGLIGAAERARGIGSMEVIVDGETYRACCSVRASALAAIAAAGLPALERQRQAARPAKPERRRR